MKIEVCVPDHWTTINMDWVQVAEAIEASMHDEFETHEATKRLISTYYGVLQSIPDEFIRDHLTDGERGIIAAALDQQSRRFMTI